MRLSFLVFVGLMVCVFLSAETKSFMVYKNADNEPCDSVNATQVCFYEYSDFENRIGKVRVENMEGILIKEMEGTYLDSISNKVRVTSPIITESIKDGLVTKYREDGSLHTQGTYNKYLLNGEFRSYYPNGQLTRIDNYKKGKFVSGQCFTTEGSDTAYFDYMVMPQYPGGIPALMQYLGQNVNYPVKAQEQGIQGRVLVSFTVDKLGERLDVRVYKSVHPLLDKEALRVVNKMKRWEPGKMDNKPVDVKYMLPVNFVLR